MTRADELREKLEHWPLSEDAETLDKFADALDQLAEALREMQRAYPKPKPPINPAEDRKLLAHRMAEDSLRAAGYEVNSVSDDWVNADKRLPTPEDADSHGDVVWLRSGIECLSRVSRGRPVDGTHWKRTGRAGDEGGDECRECPECGRKMDRWHDRDGDGWFCPDCDLTEVDDADDA